MFLLVVLWGEKTYLERVQISATTDGFEWIETVSDHARMHGTVEIS